MAPVQLASFLRPVVSLQGSCGDSLPLRLPVPLQLPQGPHHGASGSCWGLAHCLPALWQQAVELLHFTAALPWGVGSGSPAACFLIASEQRILNLLLLTATLPRGSGQWKSSGTLPHCLGAVSTRIPAIHRRTAWGQGALGSGSPAALCHTALWQPAVDLLLRTATLPRDSG